jgi:hypothetical protein
VNDGVQLKVPDVFVPSTVNVLPGVGGLLADVSDVMGSPSGSAAVTVNDSGEFSGIVTVAGAVTTGALSPTTIVVAAEPEMAFEAVNVTT